MCNVNCQYADKCVSFNKKCGSCANNFNARRDFYQPLPNPYPYWPWYPWWQTQPIIWYTSGTQQSTGDYYTSNNSDVPVTC
jgi:hypothetical protein